MVSSADYLEIITRLGRYVLVERGASDDRLTDDVIMVKDAEGIDGVEMPSAMFDEFRAKGFLRQEGREDEQRRSVLRRTLTTHRASQDDLLPLAWSSPARSLRSRLRVERHAVHGNRRNLAGNRPPAFTMLTTAPVADVEPFHKRLDRRAAPTRLESMDLPQQAAGRAFAAAARGFSPRRDGAGREGIIVGVPLASGTQPARAVIGSS